MKITPAYEMRSGTFYARVRFWGRLIDTQLILPRTLTLGHWGSHGCCTRASLEKHFEYRPADFRIPVNNLWPDEA